MQSKGQMQQIDGDYKFLTWCLIVSFSFSYHFYLIAATRFIGEFMCILWNWHSCFCILIHSSWSQWPQMFSLLTMLLTSMVYIIEAKLTWIYNFLSSIEVSKLTMWITLPWTCCHFYEKGVSLWIMKTLLFCNNMYMKRHLLKLFYLFYIVLVCSEPQQVFKHMEY